MRDFMSVVLPMPLRPITATVSPLFALSDKSWITSLSPYATFNAFTSSMTPASHSTSIQCPR
jgi:hypothetical protein